MENPYQSPEEASNSTSELQLNLSQFSKGQITWLIFIAGIPLSVMLLLSVLNWNYASVIFERKVILLAFLFLEFFGTLLAVARFHSINSSLLLLDKDSPEATTNLMMKQTNKTSLWGTLLFFLFSVPALFVVILGPAVFQMIEVLGPISA